MHPCEQRVCGRGIWRSFGLTHPIGVRGFPWLTARLCLNLLAHSVLTEYHVARKRKAVVEPSLPFDDELPGAA